MVGPWRPARARRAIVKSGSKHAMRRIILVVAGLALASAQSRVDSTVQSVMRPGQLLALAALAAFAAPAAAISHHSLQICASSSSFTPDVSWEYGCSKSTPDNGATTPPEGWCPADCHVDHYAPNFACSCNAVVTSAETCSAKLPGEWAWRETRHARTRDNRASASMLTCSCAPHFCWLTSTTQLSVDLRRCAKQRTAPLQRHIGVDSSHVRHSICRD